MCRTVETFDRHRVASVPPWRAFARAYRVVLCIALNRVCMICRDMYYASAARQRHELQHGISDDDRIEEAASSKGEIGAEECQQLCNVGTAMTLKLPVRAPTEYGVRSSIISSAATPPAETVQRCFSFVQTNEDRMVGAALSRCQCHKATGPTGRHLIYPSNCPCTPIQPPGTEFEVVRNVEVRGDFAAVGDLLGYLRPGEHVHAIDCLLNVRPAVEFACGTTVHVAYCNGRLQTVPLQI
eukprot:SAG11_NODE_661_length_7885_cov_8.956974_11_plen_240_part_00